MLRWEPHPYLERPTEEEVSRMDPDALLEWWRVYHEAIRNEREDPIRNGVVLPQWRDAEAFLADPEVDELWVFGGNRSSKSKFAAWMCMQALLKIPGTRIFCWSQNDEASKLNQQPYFWEYLPIEYRRKQKGEIVKVNYSKANGFTDKNFILPNGSQCIFKTYSQFLNDPSVIEGAELGGLAGAEGLGYVNMGNWFDEYLLSPGLLETIRPRLATRNAKNLITFTPIHGYTETVRQILHKAKTVDWKGAELLGGEQVPYVQQPVRTNSRVIYFHTKDNPYSGYERLKRDLEGEKRETILVRAYGLPTKSASSKFPKFTRESCVVKHEEIPFIRDPKYPVTRYYLLDPAPVKPWVMVWIAVDRAGVHWVYREWPDISYGEWAEWGKSNKSRPGEAARPNGFGIQDYVDLILELEDGEEIHERLIDPRMGATARQNKEGSVTMIDDLCNAGLMIVPAPGKEEDEGLQALQNLITYDTTKPIDSLNRPHFMVSDRCEQTIMCLQEYTGCEGREEAFKDFVDAIRYGAVSGLDYVDPNHVERVETGGY